jgi:hypothetical protein
MMRRYFTNPAFFPPANDIADLPTPVAQKMLTPYSENALLLFEVALSGAPIVPIGNRMVAAVQELKSQGFVQPTPDGWELTPRGRVVAEGVQAQGKAASRRHHEPL